MLLSLHDKNTFKGSCKTPLLSAQFSPRTAIGTLSPSPAYLLHLLQASLTCSTALPKGPSSYCIPTAQPLAGSHPSLLFQSFLISSGITAQGKNTMGPLSAVPNSHSCRNSALIWCENHLNNNLSGNNIGFFMWFFDKSDAAMSLACIWIKIRWHFKKKSLWKRYNNRDLYKNMHSSLSSDTENSKCSYSK